LGNRQRRQLSLLVSFERVHQSQDLNNVHR
jgi:hypothetical protein